ncbi:MAG: hypothetical protein RIS29_1478 [Bacteroidota bacterium]|jgi:hypothetical protein
MAELNRLEKFKLENLFDMGGGYVLNFTNRTFSDFIQDKINIEIYSDKYSDDGDSKAKRLRTFWLKESSYNVGKLCLALIEYWLENKTIWNNEITAQEQELYSDCLKIANRLIQDTVFEETEVFKENQEDKSFNLLAKSIKESIDKNEPEIALDRLHTYVVKYVRQLCENHAIAFQKEESLNALFGKYIKYIISQGFIESQMSERILKYSINIIESFNDIRNNRSLAHDNSILNYEESVLIFNNITNALRFIESIEDKINLGKEVKINDSENWANLPF